MPADQDWLAQVVEEIVAGFSESEEHAMFYGNVEQVYSLIDSA